MNPRYLLGRQTCYHYTMPASKPMMCYYAKDSEGTYGIASEQGLNVLYWVKSQSFLSLQPYHITHYLQLSNAIGRDSQLYRNSLQTPLCSHRSTFDSLR